MTRAQAFIGSALFLLVAPGTLAGLLPWLIVGWPAPISPPVAAAVGSALLLLGGVLLLACFSRFALDGRGTPAPIAPPDRLVVTGAYRHVRNPMYVAVVALVLGQAALFGNPGLLVYGALLWGGFHVFVTGYEEPTLLRQFPDDYPAFFAAVPRWIPRLRPWQP